MEQISRLRCRLSSADIGSETAVHREGEHVARGAAEQDGGG